MACFLTPKYLFRSFQSQTRWTYLEQKKKKIPLKADHGICWQASLNQICGSFDRKACAWRFYWVHTLAGITAESLLIQPLFAEVSLGARYYLGSAVSETDADRQRSLSLVQLKSNRFRPLVSACRDRASWMVKQCCRSLSLFSHLRSQFLFPIKNKHPPIPKEKNKHLFVDLMFSHNFLLFFFF